MSNKKNGVSSLDGTTTIKDKLIHLRVHIPEKYNYLLGVCSSLCRKSRNDFILDIIRDSVKDVLSKNNLERLLEE